MYVDSKCVVNDKLRNTIYEYMANMGVKQGDGASPELFILFLIDCIHTYLNISMRWAPVGPKEPPILLPHYNYLCLCMQTI